MKHPVNLSLTIWKCHDFWKESLLVISILNFSSWQRNCMRGYVLVTLVMFKWNYPQMHQFYVDMKHIPYVSSVFAQVIYFWSLGRLSRLTILNFQYFLASNLATMRWTLMKKPSKLDKFTANVIFPFLPTSAINFYWSVKYAPARWQI